MKVDVYLDSGVTVEVPDGTDTESNEGYQVVVNAARQKLIEMLKEDYFDIVCVSECEKCNGEGFVMEDNGDGTSHRTYCPECSDYATERN